MMTSNMNYGVGGWVGGVGGMYIVYLNTLQSLLQNSSSFLWAEIFDRVLFWVFFFCSSPKSSSYFNLAFSSINLGHP